MSLEQKCPVFQFSVKGDERGSMIVIEGGIDIPFDIKRMFYIYGSDTSVIRGQHANRESEFILINVHGTSKVKLRDGEEERIVVLDTPMKGVYIPRMVWKDMYDFSEDSVLLVLASTHYTADEYVRNFGDYVSEVATYK
nr:FdtA/QdtA family cupin domain-containing protein [uncultured Blautia sp.]